MKTLLLFLTRELRRARLRNALVLLVLAVQAAALAGGILAQTSLEADRARWETELRLADLTIHFTPAADEEMPSIEELRAIPGVAGVTRRFTSIGRVEGGLPVVVHYLDAGARPDVSDVALLDGRWFARADEAVVERSYAREHGVRIGDEIVVDPHRFATRFRVVGIGLSAEYLVPTANPEQLVPHKGSLGVVFASREALDRVFVERLYDELLVTFHAGTDTSAATAATAALLQALSERDVEVERVTPRESAFAHRYVDVLLSAGRIVTPFVSMVLALMAAIAIVVTVSRLAVERRRELAVLLAQGASPASLACAFAGVGLIGGVLGAVAGLPGALAFACASARTSAEIAGLPEPPLVVALAPLAVGAGSAIVTSTLAAALAALPLLSIRPADAIRGRADALVGIRIPAFGGPAMRYAMRNVGRRVRLSAAVVALVALAVALPAALFTTLSSWTSWSDDYSRGFAWDASVAFKAPLAEEDAAALLRAHGINAFETYVQGYAAVTRASGRGEAVRMRGVPVPAVLAQLQLSAGRQLSADDADEIVMNEAFRPDGDVPRIGEHVVVEAGGRTRSLVVVGLVRDASVSTVLVPLDTARELLGKEGRASGAHVLLSRGAERDLVLDESVASVQSKERFAAETARYLDAFTATLVPFIVLASILAFAFVGGVLGILLGERAVEHATLRALGGGARRIFAIIAIEIAVLVGAGAIASLALWVVLARVLRVPISHAWFEVALDLRARDVGVAILPVVVLAMLAAIPAAKRVLSLDLASTLRTR
jgi:ABC-type lipoprotein release transport system permease subunit